MKLLQDIDFKDHHYLGDGVTAETLEKSFLAPAPDLLTSLSDEDLKKVKVPTEEAIEAALAKGAAARKAFLEGS